MSNTFHNTPSPTRCSAKSARVMGLLEGVTYLPGWTFEVYDTPSQGVAIAITARVPDAYNPGQEVDLRIKSFVPDFTVPMQFYGWLRWRLEQIAIHEVHEWLQLQGTPIFDPHAEGADEPVRSTL